MAGDQTLSKLNGVVSCVMSVLVCLAVGVLGFQYGPAAFSYVREATTFKPAELPQYQFEPVQFDYDSSQWSEKYQTIDFDSLMGNGANRVNSQERSMRDYRP